MHNPSITGMFTGFPWPYRQGSIGIYLIYKQQVGGHNPLFKWGL